MQKQAKGFFDYPLGTQRKPGDRFDVEKDHVEILEQMGHIYRPGEKHVPATLAEAKPNADASSPAVAAESTAAASKSGTGRKAA